MQTAATLMGPAWQAIVPELVESWHEHLRQHQRVSHADADLQSEVTRYHRGENKPQVHHYLSVR